MSSFSGPTPSGIDIHEDQRGRIIGSSAAIFVITLTFVVLRLVSRKLSRAGLWWDDYFTIIAFAFSSVCIANQLILLSNGLGRHIWSLDPKDRAAKARKWILVEFIDELFIITANGFAKFAVLSFYYRIVALPRFRRLCLWTGIACAFIALLMGLTLTFQCRPIHYLWDGLQKKGQGHCYNVVAFYIGSGSVNVGENVVIFLLPVPYVLRLRTSLKQRIIVSAIFTLAGFIVVVSIIWVVVVSRASMLDFTWTYVDAGIWCTLEPNLAVVCSCIPSLRPLFTIATQGNFKHPLIKGTLHSTGNASSRTRWGSSVGEVSNGTFSQLDPSEDLRPLGHDTTIRGGRLVSEGNEDGTMEMPKHGINVKTEISWKTSNRLDYNDRLY